MPTHIPGIGHYVKDWRAGRGESRADWARVLYSAGFRLAPNVTQLAADLRAIEDADRWPYDVPMQTTFDFAGACRLAFGRSRQDVQALQALDEFLACYFFRPLGVLLKHSCPGDPTP